MLVGSFVTVAQRLEVDVVGEQVRAVAPHERAAQLGHLRPRHLVVRARLHLTAAAQVLQDTGRQNPQTLERTAKTGTRNNASPRPASHAGSAPASVT